MGRSCSSGEARQGRAVTAAQVRGSGLQVRVGEIPMCAWEEEGCSVRLVISTQKVLF